jgi:hypothetical protein
MGTHLTQEQCPSTPEEITAMHSKPYQAAVGLLNHAAVIIHPDISKAVQTVAQFASNFGKHHWDTVICIIHYLRTTRNWVLTQGGKYASIELLGYCDAEHANSPDHGHSISEYAMVLGNGCFSWSSKKQTATALSTARLNTMLSPMLVVKSSGFINSSQKLVLHLVLELHYASIIPLAFV